VSCSIALTPALSRRERGKTNSNSKVSIDERQPAARISP
jgi:hypothetical protein